MMNAQKIGLITLTLILGGCASGPMVDQNVALDETEQNKFSLICKKLGYTPDTKAWNDCIQQREYELKTRRQTQWDYSYQHRGSLYPNLPCTQSRGGVRCRR